ncbi:MAG: HAD family hydrolase [Bilifractor sp.]|jgi:phosphoglycolate phosphatase
MPDGIIFDIDGTMWDSRESIGKAWNRVLTEYGEEPFLTPDILKSEFGKTLDEIAADLLPETDPGKVKEICEKWTQVEPDAVRAEKPFIYEGLEETLDVLSRNTKLYIVSNAMSGYIECFLEVTGFGQYFSDHLCNGDTGKPKGENIDRIVRKNSMFNPVYVGDTQGDRDAASFAVVRFAWASYGFGEVTGCDYRLERPADLLKYFA